MWCSLSKCCGKSWVRWSHGCVRLLVWPPFAIWFGIKIFAFIQGRMPRYSFRWLIWLHLCQMNCLLYLVTDVVICQASNRMRRSRKFLSTLHSSSHVMVPLLIFLRGPILSLFLRDRNQGIHHRLLESTITGYGGYGGLVIYLRITH